MTSEEQLRLWVAGQSVHRDDVFIDIVDEHDNVLKRERVEGGECCPDFSCCEPRCAWPIALRERFAKSSEDERLNMLFMSLSDLLKDEPVYIAGQSAEN